jgi:membrane protease YdiL (CAAX protease family)
MPDGGDQPIDSRSAVKPQAWGIGDAAAGAAVGFLAGNVLSGIVGAAAGINSFAALVAALVGLWVGLLGAPLLASRRKGSGSLATDFGFVVRWRDALVGVPIGLGSQLLLVPLVYLPLQWFIDTDELSKPAKDLADRAHGATYVVLGVLLVVGAPLVEELFFRGLLLRSIARRFGDRWAVAGSAVAFGLAHFEPLLFPALVGLGVVLAILALRTGRLGPGIWAHAAFNSVVAIALAASHA